MSRAIRVGGEFSSEASCGIIKIRLIYGSRNTNVEHCSDYQWLNCRPFEPRTSHYIARSNTSGPGSSQPLFLLLLCCNCWSDADARYCCLCLTILVLSTYAIKLNEFTVFIGTFLQILPEADVIFIGKQKKRMFWKSDRMTINDYSNPPLVSSLAFRILPSPPSFRSRLASSGKPAARISYTR